MKTKDIETIIKYGLENDATAEQIARRIVSTINATWYHQRKDVCEDIIEVEGE